MDAQSEEQGTPLNVACLSNSPLCTQVLLEKGAQTEFKDYSGNTPFMIALKHKYLSCLVHLFKRGVDMNARNLVGDTPLHLACRDGYDSHFVKVWFQVHFFVCD